MTKELKALNKVKKFKDDCCMFGSSDIEIDRELDIIESALKRLEEYETKPRKKGFGEQDNRLRLAYQEMGKYSNSEEVPQELRGKPFGDIIGIVPKDEKRRWDLYFLFDFFLRRPIHNDEWDRNKECIIKYPCFLEELENRGYDVKTIYFEISKRNKRKKYVPFENYLRDESKELIKNEKDRQIQLKALEIIKDNKTNELELVWFNGMWFVFAPNCPRAIMYGTRKEDYDLLKEILC